MANIAVTAAKVSPLPGARLFSGKVAGGGGNLGDAVYIAADGDVEQSDASVAGTAYAFGIVVAVSQGKETFVAGDAVTICYDGPVAGFSGMTPNDVLYVSDDAGLLADGAGTVSCKIARALAADILLVIPQVTEA